jgi:hypothetical protein
LVGDNDPPLIFISYGRSDAGPFVEGLAEDLAARGFRVWRDLSSLVLGPNWNHQVERAIDESRVVLAVLSPWSVRPPEPGRPDSVALDEIAYAKFGPQPKPVIPVMAIASIPPLFLFRSHWLDFTDVERGSDAYDQRLERLLASLTQAIETGIEDNTRFNNLQPMEFDGFLARKRSNFVGRDWLFARVEKWLSRRRTTPLLMLLGEPGRGKSAFVAEWIYRNPESRLIGFHICRRQDAATLDCSRMVRSIAAMIAASVPAFAAQLPRLLLEGEPLSPTECQKNPLGAFERGIVGPLRSILVDRTRAIVIDGLDEAMAHDSTTSILDLIGRVQDIDLGPLQLVVTSRPVSTVRRSLGFADVIDLDACAAENDADVRRMIRAEGPSDILGSVLETKISDTADANFLVARLLLDTWARHGELDRMRGLGALHSFYDREFRLRFGAVPEDEGFEPVRQMLGLVVGAIRPLSIAALREVMSLPSDWALHRIIEKAEPYVEIVGDKVAPFHLTFSEWLQQPSNPFAVDERAAQQSIALFVAKAMDDVATKAWRGGPDGFLDRIDRSCFFGLEEDGFDYLAFGSPLGDGASDGIAALLIALLPDGRGLTVFGGNWLGSTRRIPRFLQGYFNKVLDSNSADGLLELIKGMSRACEALYFSTGLFQRDPSDKERYFLSQATRNGNCITQAFGLSASAAGLVGGDESYSETVKAILRTNPGICPEVRRPISYMRYMVGGFETARWAHKISGYFSDAATAPYIALCDSTQLLDQLCLAEGTSPSPLAG